MVFENKVLGTVFRARRMRNGMNVNTGFVEAGNFWPVQ
jgi:hypothetical protein